MKRATGEAAGTARLGGDSEEAMIGADGMIYVNSENTHQVVVFESEIPGGEEALPHRGNVDFAAFNPDSKLVFSSSGEGILSTYREKSAGDHEVAGAFQTKSGAKTMAFDPKTKKTFMPAADYTETAGSEPGNRPRRIMKPDSFVVLARHESEIFRKDNPPICLNLSLAAHCSLRPHCC